MPASGGKVGRKFGGKGGSTVATNADLQNDEDTMNRIGVVSTFGTG